MSVKDTIVASIEAELDVLKNLNAEPVAEVAAAPEPVAEVAAAPEPVAVVETAPVRTPIIQLAIDQAAERLARAPK